MIDLYEYPDIDFPNGFKWGATTAGQQIEGNNQSFHDEESLAPQFGYGGMPYVMAGKACNSYEMYEDDIQLLKDMNLNIYRMSIEWCRIEPNEGEFNQEAI